ncbi:MAG: GGDEF domain-containing protein [Pseudomonadota bacterium]
MKQGVETSHRIAEIALGCLKELGLAATPKNIEVWCAHVDGKSPALSRDIQKVLDEEGRVSQPDADRFYSRHIQRSDLSRDVVEVVARFQNEVAGLRSTIASSSENAAGYTSELGRLTNEISQSSNKYPTISDLLENVVNVAKSMRDENAGLEKKLAASAEEVARLKHNVKEIEAEAIKDPLTGIANRREFDKTLERKVAEADEFEAPMALILSDIDHFKSFNDTWGHQTGDQVLRLVAEVMGANVKGQDLLARYGGEEFAIILPGTTLENAVMLADRIRAAVEARRLKKRRTGEDLGVITMSLGVAAHQAGESPETLVERADKCLYSAKSDGRNCVHDENKNRTPPSEEREKGAA